MKIILALFISLSIVACGINKDDFQESETDIRDEVSKKAQSTVKEESIESGLDLESVSLLSILDESGLEKLDIGTDFVPVQDSQGTIEDLTMFNLDVLPKDPSVGFYTHSGSLYILTTLRDSVMEGASTNLNLKEVKGDGTFEDYKLVEAIEFIQPFFAYNGNLLYYSCLGQNNKAYLGEFNLDSKENNIIKTYDLVKDSGKGLYTGSFISYLQKTDRGILYQRSTYKGDNILSQEPEENFIGFLNPDSKEIPFMNIDSLVDLGEVIVCHERMFTDSTRVSFLTKEYEEVYTEDKFLLNELEGAKLLNYKNKPYVIYKDNGPYVLLTSLEDKKTYNLSKLIDEEIEGLRIFEENIIVNMSNNTYIYK